MSHPAQEVSKLFSSENVKMQSHSGLQRERLGEGRSHFSELQAQRRSAAWVLLAAAWGYYFFFFNNKAVRGAMTYLITQRAPICCAGHTQVQSMPVAAGHARVIPSLMKWIICRISLTMFCAEEAGCFRAASECEHDLPHLETIS